jgi:putative endopeptidase
MRIVLSAQRYALTVLLLAAPVALSAQQFISAPDTQTPVEPKAPQSMDLTAIDKTVDPCTDFYQFACGNWRKNNPIPADQASWGRFHELSERNRYLLYIDLKKAADSPHTALQHKYGDFFAACMNTDQADKLGDQPILPLFRQIDAIKDKKDLATVVAYLDSKTPTGILFRFGVEQDQKIEGIHQGGLTLPDRDYYIQDDPHMQDIRDKYRAYVVTVFKLIGDSEEQAKTAAGEVLDIETALAKGAIPRVELRDPDKRYHIMALTALDQLEPNFDWSAYFAGVNAPKVSDINVGQPDFFKAENQLIGDQTLDALKAYLKFHAINGVAPWLSQPFADASFDFFQKTLQGQVEQTARWKRCTAATDRALGEAVGQDWVKENFPPQAKQNMEQLVAALKKALAADIQALPWMTEETKKQAEVKLDDFRQKIGYPDKWRDYSKFTVTRNNFVEDLNHSSAFEFNYDLNKVGNDATHRQRLLQPPAERHQFPRRHSPAAFL